MLSILILTVICHSPIQQYNVYEHKGIHYLIFPLSNISETPARNDFLLECSVSFLDDFTDKFDRKSIFELNQHTCLLLTDQISQTVLLTQHVTQGKTCKLN